MQQGQQIQPWRRICGRDAHHLRTGQHRASSRPTPRQNPMSSPTAGSGAKNEPGGSCRACAMHDPAPRAPGSGQPCPGSRQVSSGSSASAVPMPDEHRVARRPHADATESRAASPVTADRAAARQTGLAVGGHGELERSRADDCRCTRRMCPAWARRRFLRARVRLRPTTPLSASRRWPAPRHLRIGIFERGNHARDAGRQ